MEKNLARLRFAFTALRDYKVGAVSPSSKYLIKRVLHFVPKNLQVVIECGPGEGAMTHAILKHLAPDGTLIVIESNREFVERLLRINDPRIRVIEGNAEEVMQSHLPKANLILSSVPFSFLKPKNRELLTKLVHEQLATGGAFIVFHQYYPIAKKVLEKVFGGTVVAYEWRNFLPCFVFVARKK